MTQRMTTAEMADCLANVVNDVFSNPTHLANIDPEKLWNGTLPGMTMRAPAPILYDGYRGNTTTTVQRFNTMLTFGMFEFSIGTIDNVSKAANYPDTCYGTLSLEYMIPMIDSYDQPLFKNSITRSTHTIDMASLTPAKLQKLIARKLLDLLKAMNLWYTDSFSLRVNRTTTSDTYGIRKLVSTFENLRLQAKLQKRFHANSTANPNRDVEQIMKDIDASIAQLAKVVHPIMETDSMDAMFYHM